MKVSEFRKLIREEVRKIVKEADVMVTGDYNMSDFKGGAKKASEAYLKTPEGVKATKLIKTLVSKPFSASDLTKTIKACKFTAMNNFKAAARAGGLLIDGLGNIDNKGNGDFEVMNDTYTDEGAAIAFLNNTFYRVG